MFINLTKHLFELYHNIIFRQNIAKLLANGSAYRCFCTERRLNLLRRDAVRSYSIPKYDNRCRNLSLKEIKEKITAGTPNCIRFKVCVVTILLILFVRFQLLRTYN